MACSKSFSITIAPPVVDCFDPDDIVWVAPTLQPTASGSASAAIVGGSGSFSMATQNLNLPTTNTTVVEVNGTLNNLAAGGCQATVTVDFNYDLWSLGANGSAFTIDTFINGAPFFDPGTLSGPTGHASGNTVFPATGAVPFGSVPFKVRLVLVGSRCTSPIGGSPCTPSTVSGTITVVPLPP